MLIPYLHHTLTLCLVGLKIGRMENRGRKIGWKTVFSTVWQKKENIEEEKSGRKFSPGPTILIFPNREENCGEKSGLMAFLHKCHFLPTLIHDLMTFSPTFFFSKKKTQRERALEKKKRENESCTYKCWNILE